MNILHIDHALSGAWADRLAGWTNALGLPVDPTLRDGESWWIAVAGPGDDGEPIACLRWRPGLGLRVPRPHWRLGRLVHASAELGLFQVLDTLQLAHDLSGEAELADLALAAEAPEGTLRELIEAALAMAKATTAASVVVELQGARDGDGSSPVWRGLGRHFFSGDPEQASRRHGEAWPAHLAQLLPRQTLYRSFLSEPADRALGLPGPAAGPALRALQALGAWPGPHVRLDDGGPVWVWRAGTARSV